ncbi:MAG TPA: DUF711 family protein, partial [bacterium]|nr:DUF711 family protein [bacterium]
MIFTTEEILETVRMIQLDHLDIRTITLGIDLLGCRRDSVKETVRLLSEKLKLTTDGFLDTVNKVGVEYGIPIVNKRVAITPVSLLLSSTDMEEYIYLAEKLDGVAKDIGLDFIGGYTCFLEYEVSQSDRALLKSIPAVLNETERLCSSIVPATTKAGINLDAIREVVPIILETARLKNNPSVCAKLIVICNPPPDNPFMAGAFHGIKRGNRVLNVGISGPGAIRSALEKLPENSDILSVVEEIKR